MAQIALALTNKNDTPKTSILIDSSGNEITTGNPLATTANLPSGSAVQVLDSGGVNKLAVDSSGRITLVPNGVVEIGDGTTPSQKLAVDASGRLTLVPTQTVEILDSAGTNKLAIDASGRVTLVPNQTFELVDSAGTNKAAVDASGRQVMTAVSGAALQADQTNTRLAVSLYGQNATAGDTAIGVTNTGTVKTNISQLTAGLNFPISFAAPQGTAGDVSATGTNTTVTATLTNVAAKTWYLTGFTITALLSTALGSADITISGLQNTLTMEMVTDDTTLGATETIISVMFPVPRPASAVNTSVSVSVAALGANTGKVAVTIHGQNF